MKIVRDLVKCVHNMDRNEETQIGFLSIISRQDRKLGNEINETKIKLRKYYESKKFIFVDNSNINESCLNNSKLHLNSKGSNMLPINIKKSLCQV